MSSVPSQPLINNNNTNTILSPPTLSVKFIYIF